VLTFAHSEQKGQEKGVNRHDAPVFEDNGGAPLVIAIKLLQVAPPELISDHPRLGLGAVLQNKSVRLTQD
jgi:hypothetical protein